MPRREGTMGWLARVRPKCPPSEDSGYRGTRPFARSALHSPSSATFFHALRQMDSRKEDGMRREERGLGPDGAQRDKHGKAAARRGHACRAATGRNPSRSHKVLSIDGKSSCLGQFLTVPFTSSRASARLLRLGSCCSVVPGCIRQAEVIYGWK